LQLFLRAASPAILSLLAVGILAMEAEAQVRGVKVDGKAVQDYVSEHQGKRWAVVIGIDDYEKVPPLKYAVADAKAMAKILERRGFQVMGIYNRDATRRKIVGALGDKLIKKVAVQDSVLIFYAGHGETLKVEGGKEMGYLLPVEGEQEALAETGISMGVIRELADALPTKQVLFIVDACYGGIAGQRFRALPKMTEDYLRAITRERGRQLITAGGVDQQAMEGPEWGHSVFTYYLLEGLDKGLADLNEDGIIPASELYMYLDQHVFAAAQLKGHNQRPELWALAAERGEFVFFTDLSQKAQAAPPTEFETERQLLTAERQRLEAERKIVELQKKQAEEKAKLAAEDLRRQIELERQEFEKRQAAEAARLEAERRKLEEERAKYAALESQGTQAARERREFERRQAEESKRLEAERRKLEDDRSRLAALEQRTARLDQERQEFERRQAEQEAQLEAERRKLEAERGRIASLESQGVQVGRERQEFERRQAAEAARLEQERRKLDEERARLAAEQAKQEEEAKRIAEERRKLAQQPAILEARARAYEAPRRQFEEIKGKDGAPMVLIPAGEFTMGSEDGSSDEKPVHRVYLNSYYLDRYEVTVGRYAAFLTATGNKRPLKWSDADMPADSDRPVIGVDWDDANAYCQWADKRLPTEAEWEKAARGPEALKYPWGSEEPLAVHAHFGKCCEWNGYKTVQPVGSMEAGMGPYGNYELAGNVWEWVADWYEKDYYESSPNRNPAGPPKGKKKVFRGGSWYYVPFKIRITDRAYDAPSYRDVILGFRCAKDAPR
jgi:formylglycine-generating enzyme required for sulfatase activity